MEGDIHTNKQKAPTHFGNGQSFYSYKTFNKTFSLWRLSLFLVWVVQSNHAMFNPLNNVGLPDETMPAPKLHIYEVLK